MNYRTEILALAHHVPETIFTNQDMEKILDTSDEWIRTRTGIEERHIADPKKGETTLSMCFEAAKKALSKAGVSAEELDVIVIGTVTPDSLMPTTANSLQALLGAKNAFSFDIQAACSGFLYGLSIADAFIRAGQLKTALVIGAETLSSIVNWRDRSTAVLFGDGAGAAVVRRTENQDTGVLGIQLYSDGNYGSILNLKAGFCKIPSHSKEFNLIDSKVQMQGGEVFKHAVRNMVEASRKLLAEHRLTTADIDFFVFHQANIRIIDYCIRELEVPREKTWINVQKYGNISAATLPTCLDEALEAGALKRGDTVLMATFGGGLTWAAGLIKV